MDLQSPISPRFGGYLPVDQVDLVLIMLSSLPQEIFEERLDSVEDAFRGQ